GITMRTSTLYLSTFVLLTFFVACSSCHDSVDQKANSQGVNQSASRIADAEWRFENLRIAPKEQSFARCNEQGLCWLWNKQGVWLVERGYDLRQVYLEVQAADYSIGNVFFRSPSAGWMTRPTALYQTKDAGTTWTQASLPKKTNAADLYFRDSELGCLVGSQYRTLLKHE